MADFRNNCKKTKDYLEFIKNDEPEKTYTCRAKIDPSTCNFVLAYGGLHACLKCKNIVDIEEVRVANVL